MVSTRMPVVADPKPKLLPVIRLLLVVALALSSYLAWVSLAGGRVFGCGSSAECNEVLYSRWGYWLGVPVSVFGALVYLTLLAATFRLNGRTSERSEWRGWNVLVPSCIVVMGTGLWFALLQLSFLNRICPLCMAIHLCGVTAASMLLLSGPIPIRSSRSRRQARPWLGSVPVARLCLGGLAVLAILILGQVLQQPKRHAVVGIGAGVTVEPSRGLNRQVKILDGEFALKLREVPLIGSAEAPNVVVNLFDYTCYACRILHAQLEAAQRSLSNQLAIVSLPVPLDATCNATVTEVFPAHTNACEYARIGLAVWKANRDAFPQFEQWVFSTPYAPALEQTRDYASHLIGGNALESAIHDPWVESQIHYDVEIYRSLYSKLGKHSLPQLIVGTNVILGTFSRMEVLYRLLNDQFGLGLAKGSAVGTEATR